MPSELNHCEDSAPDLRSHSALPVAKWQNAHAAKQWTRNASSRLTLESFAQAQKAGKQEARRHAARINLN
jgi:uncharacterized protein YfaA (DUF2138 family)